MEARVLVAYATTHGSTREIAEAVAKTVQEQGFAVDIRPAGAVKSPAGYQAVILGTALYIGHANKDALKFISRSQSAFSNGTPVAIFASGPLSLEDDMQFIRNTLDKDLAKFPWIKPCALEIFGGKFDPTTLSFPWNLLPAMKNKPASDIRDWEAIRKWAVEISNQFRTLPQN